MEGRHFESSYFKKGCIEQMELEVYFIWLNVIQCVQRKHKEGWNYKKLVVLNKAFPRKWSLEICFGIRLSLVKGDCLEVWAGSSGLEIQGSKGGLGVGLWKEIFNDAKWVGNNVEFALGLMSEFLAGPLVW